MAFNHVNDCSCPVGCCDCGSRPYEDEVCLWHDAEKDELFLSSRTPPDWRHWHKSWFEEYVESGKWTLLEVCHPELLNKDQKVAVFDYIREYGDVLISE